MSISFKKKKSDIKKIISFVNQAEDILKSNEIDNFGELLNESWHYKKKLSSRITNNKINELYNLSIKNGALGGKLLGAGEVVSCFCMLKKINKEPY